MIRMTHTHTHTRRVCGSPVVDSGSVSGEKVRKMQLTPMAQRMTLSNAHCSTCSHTHASDHDTRAPLSVRLHTVHTGDGHASGTSLTQNSRTCSLRRKQPDARTSHDRPCTERFSATRESARTKQSEIAQKRTGAMPEHVRRKQRKHVSTERAFPELSETSVLIMLERSLVLGLAVLLELGVFLLFLACSWRHAHTPVCTRCCDAPA